MGRWRVDANPNPNPNPNRNPNPNPSPSPSLWGDGGGDEQVLELDVAVQDAVRVHAGERVEELLHG